MVVTGVRLTEERQQEQPSCQDGKDWLGRLALVLLKQLSFQTQLKTAICGCPASLTLGHVT